MPRSIRNKEYSNVSFGMRVAVTESVRFGCPTFEKSTKATNKDAIAKSKGKTGRPTRLSTPD